MSDSEFPALSVTKGGVVPQLSDVAKSQNGDVRKLVRAGDFVINSRSDRKGSSGISELDGSVSVVYTVLRPREGLDLNFAHHLLRSSAFQEEFYRWGSGIVADLWSTRYSAMKRIALPIPPLDEQRDIADYLDRETQKIDELITEQRGLIETLRERRRSLVTRLVTRGLDRHADMTEVSSKWLDFVPASWRLTRFRFVATIGNVMVDPKVGDVMHDVLIAPNHVERNTGRLLAIETADAQGADSSKYRVKSGQIVYSKIRPTLNKAVTAPCDCLCSADMYPISFDSDRVSNRYALYQMLSRPIHDYVTERSMRVKMPKVNREELADLPWLLPPFDVQEAISDEIDEQTSRIDEIISESEDLIALSQERRAALITAAVTGQIDVRTAA
ncbi:restriction endonuclease subunit S [Brevibacterium permense]|uniref:restriction endonuclease subunit S n=1 Tax=Brevibacterium permense TaxID=234834 RepID=UPI0021D112C6|nr:restriction endonuclease subunit S [Brevibacterium permense]MCU4297065.1 restriction endonuclease subunit S [Brevibacterium permense]